MGLTEMVTSLDHLWLRVRNCMSELLEPRVSDELVSTHPLVWVGYQALLYQVSGQFRGGWRNLEVASLGQRNFTRMFCSIAFILSPLSLMSRGVNGAYPNRSSKASTPKAQVSSFSL